MSCAYLPPLPVGLSISSMLEVLGFGNVERRILMVGLDAAGKTTVLYKLKAGETLHTVPTVGFNVETLKYKSITFTMWDIGGQDKIRPLWRHYYEGTDAVIFVVDANDRERINLVSLELSKLMAAPELRDSALLVFANKQDLPNSFSAAELMEKLQLSNLRCRDYFVQPCVATSGEGLHEGFDWISRILTDRKR